MNDGVVEEDEELLDLMNKLPNQKYEDGPLETSQNFSPMHVNTQPKESHRSVQQQKQQIKMVATPASMHPNSGITASVDLLDINASSDKYNNSKVTPNSS